VNAMKPSLAPLTSGPVPCANAPPGRAVLIAPNIAAVPAPALRNARRSIARAVRPVPWFFVAIDLVILWFAAPRREQKTAIAGHVSVPSTAALPVRPVVGPWQTLYKRRAKSVFPERCVRSADCQTA